MVCSKVHSRVRRLMVGQVWVVGLLAATVSADPQITGVSPGYGWNSTTINATITGTGILVHPDLEVNLTRTGEPNVAGTGAESVSMSEMTVDFDLNGAKAGWWDLSVSNPDLGDAFFANALAVKQAPTIERISAWGGPVQAMEVRDREVDGQMRQLGYVARGSGMVILDVTDPSNMIELSSLDLESSGVYDIAVQGDYAYVGGRDSYLSVVNVSDPINPRLVATGLRFRENTPVTDVSVYGNAAYIKHGGTGNRDGDFGILDISDPETLDQAASFHGLPDIPGFFTSTVAGNYLYVVVYRGDLTHEEPLNTKQLFVYDLSADELAPILVGTTSLLVGQRFNVSSLALDGNRAYVTAPYRARDWRLLVVDVSNAQAPTLVGLHAPTDIDFNFPIDIAVSAGRAFVADPDVYTSPPERRPDMGLGILDLTDPSSAMVLGSLRTHGSVYGVTLDGTTAYLYDHGEGVVAVNVSDPINPRRLGNWHSPGYIRALDKDGDMLVFSDWWNGITFLDVSDARAPTLTGVYQTELGGSNGVVRAQNGFAYLAAGYNHLEVVDFSQPSNPVRVGGYQFPENPNPGTASEFLADGLGVNDDVLVVSTTYSLNHAFDITNPATPIHTGRLDGPSMVDWAISDDFVGVGGYDGGFGGMMYDLLDPYDPVPVVGYGEGPGFPWTDSVHVAAHRIYMMSVWYVETVAVYEYDVSNGFVLTPVASFKARISAMAVDNEVAFAVGLMFFPDGTSFGRAALLALDVGNLNSANQHPGVIAVAYNGSGHESLHLEGPYVYLGGERHAGNEVGPSLVIYHLNSLGSFNGDGDSDLSDFAGFQACFGRTGGPAFDRQCKPFDFDQDGDVDGGDFGIFREGMTGPM